MSKTSEKPENGNEGWLEKCWEHYQKLDPKLKGSTLIMVVSVRRSVVDLFLEEYNYPKVWTEDDIKRANITCDFADSSIMNKKLSPNSD